MYKPRNIGFTLLFFLSFLFSPYNVNAEGPKAKVAESSRLQKEEFLCRHIQEEIKNKREIREFVNTSIQMGNNACSVIKCSIIGGGDLQQVICGALEAATTKDVVSRCSIDAGADAREVVAILSNISEKGLCNVMPEKPEIINPPPSGTRGGFLSPSRF